MTVYVIYKLEYCGEVCNHIGVVSSEEEAQRVIKAIGEPDVYYDCYEVEDTIRDLPFKVYCMCDRWVAYCDLDSLDYRTYNYKLSEHCYFVLASNKNEAITMAQKLARP